MFIYLLFCQAFVSKKRNIFKTKEYMYFIRKVKQCLGVFYNNFIIVYQKLLLTWLVKL